MRDAQGRPDSKLSWVFTRSTVKNPPTNASSSSTYSFMRVCPPITWTGWDSEKTPAPASEDREATRTLWTGESTGWSPVISRPTSFASLTVKYTSKGEGSASGAVLRTAGSTLFRKAVYFSRPSGLPWLDLACGPSCSKGPSRLLVECSQGSWSVTQLCYSEEPVAVCRRSASPVSLP